MNNFSQLAPVVLFAYKRPIELAQTIKALQANFLSSESELYVFVDGPKNAADTPKVAAVYQLVEAISGFRTIHRHYATANRGLANSVIAGVSQVMAQHGRAIVLEDDLVTSPNFLDFMNQALQQYQHEPKVFSLAGYNFAFNEMPQYPFDGFFYPRTGSWGWATWADRWQLADWHLTDYDEFMADKSRRRSFHYYGSDRLRMLRKYRAGTIDSWAIRWCYAQAKVSGLTLRPTFSKVKNIGFSAESTNTNGYNRYKTVLDPGTVRHFRLPDSLTCPDYYVRRMRQKFSLPARLVSRIFSEIIQISRI